MIVLAGFQGVDPSTKEITTLGRGGSDTTAVAMAGFFKADACEIRKDVHGVYSADPKIVPDAKLIESIDYATLSEMCRWGARVLHHKSTEVAEKLCVPLSVMHVDGDVPYTRIEQKTSVPYGAVAINVQNTNEDTATISITFSKPLITESRLKLKSILNQSDVKTTNLRESQQSIGFDVSQTDSTQMARTMHFEFINPN